MIGNSIRHIQVKMYVFYFCILQVQRIPEYDKYLNELLQETDQSHPDFEDLKRAADKVRNVSTVTLTCLCNIDTAIFTAVEMSIF